MRRARITVTANIPVRRKFQLENAKKLEKIEPNEHEKKDNEKVNTDANNKLNNEEIEQKSELEDDKIVDEQVTNHLDEEKTSESEKIEPEVTTFNLNETSSLEAKKPKIIENIEIKPPITANELLNSPSKSITNRVCFMRPVPRLDGHGRIRRNSIQGSGASASESEDDIRRNTTQTNNPKSSDNSAQSNVDKEINSNNNVNNNINNNTGGGNSKINMKQRRKLIVSESTRKLAEARREFQIKHENKQPDRTKLTMYDLIYYNPSTNPMKRGGDPPSINKTVVETNTDEQTEEEVDDPSESAMPVPQIKVGPDGQLIIDEQSLVIERTGLKKNREALAKRQAVVDDDNSFGGGFYKRRKRVKEWPKWETIKFYKALSTIGTDFLLMQTLFPKRSRQEIKLKFKKEEKLNRKLVEKALSCKLNFDIDGLKQELETFEELEESPPKPQPQAISGVKIVKRRKLSRRIAVTSLGEAGEVGDEELAQNDEKRGKRRKRVSRKKDSSSIEKPSKISTTSSVASVESDGDKCDETDSDSGTEVYRPRPTRSGRTPKAKNRIRAKHVLDSILGNDRSDEKTLEESEKSTENSQLAVASISKSMETSNHQMMTIETIETSVPDISSVEPGSLVIVSNESADEPGKTVVQVYMVKSNIQGPDNTFSKTLTPVNIETDMFSAVTNELTTISTLDNHEK